MSDNGKTRRRVLGTLAAGSIGTVALFANQRSANAQLSITDSYAVEDTTTTVSGDIVDVALSVECDIGFSADKQITQLGLLLEARQDGEFQEVDLSVIQLSSKEKQTTQTLSGSLAPIVDMETLIDSSVTVETRLTGWISADGQRVQETVLKDSATLQIEDGRVQSDFGINATGNFEVSQQSN